jgi:hypothetical protein
MVRYELFDFASAPGTGAEWFCRAAQLAGLGVAFTREATKPFAGNGKDRFRVSMVRHPCDWLYEIYTLGVDDLHEIGCFGRLNRGGRFEDFVREYLDRPDLRIGQVHDTFRSDSVLRYEDLPWAFCELARTAKVSMNFLRHPFFCQPPNGPYRPRIEALLRSEILRREWNLVERYDYF